MSLLPYVLTEMRDRVNEYKIRLNNKIPHGDHTLARVPKTKEGHSSRGGNENKPRNEMTFQRANTPHDDRNFVQSCEIARFHRGTII